MGKVNDAPVCIALAHDVDEGAVDHLHFSGEVPVGEVNDFIADKGVFVGEVVGAGPVEGEVGEGALGAPAAGDVEVVDELLHVLAHVVVTSRLSRRTKGAM